MNPAADIVIVHSTVPPQESARISRALLEQHLAACVSIVPVRSLYWWNGKIYDDGEDLLVIKTRSARLEKLIGGLRSIHPYEVPEIVVLPVIGGNPSYLDWVRGETRGGP
ncbi:MAG TPA: divalent-cation tolerance protein CutA [Methanoregula sp.]|nr:divalent-cation tolerance protein CutA [Methanoregula sp.]